ncbi:prepilin-type N-terminal cleavage/methylation domain-containing protein [Pseudidiomarina halophila]|uniref:Prepilin-type cleavage/methylation domain-containing protein n=1 Tax=Pseudidiomarina halophila TaxID=1449799 RepID=A0A432XZ24_9GAMM|nr:prepilin-type N-terminal cleavage/methylation domain-containing protein [Pseudidiomarina halophila]RUO53970.1 hypothetical protein CWI69_00590 [Pseudidiomarina halophila]
MTSCKRLHRGFTFIEVLVALVIIAIGVAGLVSLQRMFIQSSERASSRTAAMEVAQRKIAQLRFQEFADLAAGSETVSLSGEQFSSSWSVTSQYFVAGTWVTASSPSAPTPLPAEPDAKAVLVSVGWTERGGASENLEVESWFTSVQARDGGLAVTQPGAREQPQVTYNPGAAPEVIAVRLTDDGTADTYQVKETTKPTPQVQRQGDRLQVSFNTVTYNQATQTQRIEDFATVNCACQFDGQVDGIGKAPARLTLIDGVLMLDPEGGRVVNNKVTGIPEPKVSQSPLCSICCRDHHDNTELVNEGVVYRNDSLRTQSGNHRHFKNVGGLAVAGQGETYEESCRLRRVNGLFEVYPDWQLEAVSVMSSEFLVSSASNLNYSDYVRSVVKALVLGQQLPAEPSGRGLNVVPGRYQLIGRAIYLDDMSNSHLTAVRAAIAANESDWIEKVPFYEVNLTLLGEWASTNSAVAEVSNEAIQTIVNPDQDYYGTYSRGRVQALDDGTATIRMQSQSGNASILANQAIHPDDTGSSKTSSLNVSVTSQVDEETELFSVTGDLRCITRDNKGNEVACKSSDLNNLSISVSNLNISCELKKGTGNSTSSFSCDGVPSGSTFSISFSLSGASASITPSTVIVENLSHNEVHNILIEIF